MNTFGYDPDVPGGFQDADLEMAELQSEARRIARLKKAGICVHGWTGEVSGVLTCHDCGKTWPTQAHMEEDQREALI